MDLMGQQALYFRDDLHAKLKKEKNMSLLVSQLLENYYCLSDANKLEVTEQDLEILEKAKAIKEKQKKIDALEEEIEKRKAKEKKDSEFTKKMDDYPINEEEYRKGLAEGLWRSYLQYVKIKVENEAV